jgi:N-methylhydantoinase B/oxoprolinase/acetone carboxylase alpha subunit
MNLPIEALELDAPIRVHHFGLVPGSGGAGQFRGGLGCRREYEIMAGEVTVTYRGERHDHPARGSLGGEPGGLASARILRAAGGEESIPSKQVTTLYPGDRLCIETAGGGGYGAMEERSQAALADDIANGKIAGR